MTPSQFLEGWPYAKLSRLRRRVTERAKRNQPRRGERKGEGAVLASPFFLRCFLFFLDMQDLLSRVSWNINDAEKNGKNDGRTTGLEPATFGSTIQRSNQLSYDRRMMVHHEG